LADLPYGVYLFSVLEDMRKRAPRGTDTESGYTPLITFPYRIVQRVRAFFKNISQLNIFRLNKMVGSKTKSGIEKLRTKYFHNFAHFTSIFGSSASWYKMCRA
jgi:hypothetical protein